MHIPTASFAHASARHRPASLVGDALSLLRNPAILGSWLHASRLAELLASVHAPHRAGKRTEQIANELRSKLLPPARIGLYPDIEVESEARRWPQFRRKTMVRPARPPASHSAQNQPIRPPASGRSEWGDQQRPSVLPPPSVPSLDEARRREAQAAKTAARRIRDLTARGSRPPAPAGEAPSLVELALADRLGSYVGALLDWWKARNVDTSRIEVVQERLHRAWQDLVAAARLLLRRNGGSGTTEEACGALTQAITQSRPEARTAYERWLDRAYQPAAVPAPEADPAARASNHIRRVATSVVPRQSEPPERTPQGE
ncbi:hypothetical protein [Azospirillum argentinense]|uniref:hypothetical protein n=1 Tax=Azospirillum argentinense TaxID=2970906 RepID=UPI0032DF2ABF